MVKAMPIDKTYSYAGYSIRARYDEKNREGNAWCPICGDEQIAAVRSMGPAEAVGAAKGKVVVHMRLAHHIKDEEETQPSATESPTPKEESTDAASTDTNTN
jgi:hypothetical protein